MYGIIQSFSKTFGTDGSVIVDIEIARVSFLYLFVITKTCLLPDFVLGNGPSISMDIFSKGYEMEKASSASGEVVVGNFFNMKGICPPSCILRFTCVANKTTY